MVCAECFRAKGEPEANVPCQNPKCYFYLRTQAVDREVANLSDTFANGLTFGKAEVKTGFGSDTLQTSRNDVWGFRPPCTAVRALQSQLQGSVFSTIAASHGGLGKTRSLSFSDQPRRLTASQVAGKEGQVKLMRTRMMSVPGTAMLLEDSDGLGDVEDAFLNSPLPPELRRGDVEV